LNKKSAQKQKRSRNNGFSQAVVPKKETKHILATKNQTKTTRRKNRRVFTF
jgi:hypothetical protein